MRNGPLCQHPLCAGDKLRVFIILRDSQIPPRATLLLDCCVTMFHFAKVALDSMIRAAEFDVEKMMSLTASRQLSHDLIMQCCQIDVSECSWLAPLHVTARWMTLMLKFTLCCPPSIIDDNNVDDCVSVVMGGSVRNGKVDRLMTHLRLLGDAKVCVC